MSTWRGKSIASKPGRHDGGRRRLVGAWRHDARRPRKGRKRNRVERENGIVIGIGCNRISPFVPQNPNFRFAPFAANRGAVDASERRALMLKFGVRRKDDALAER